MRWTVVGGDNIRRHVLEYNISRNMPSSIKSIGDIVFNEHENLDCLIDVFVGDDGYEVTLINS